MQTIQVGNPKYQPVVTLDDWSVPTGTSGDVVPEEEFIRYDENMMVTGDSRWPPSIISYHGHFIPLPKVSIKYLGRSDKFLKCLVTFLAKEWDAELRLLSFKPVFTCPAWQGENNFIHLMEELPGEDMKELDMSLFLATAEELDMDYLTRIQMLYPDDEITRLAPELFFAEDEAYLTR